jgi:amino acid transporter
MGITAAAMTNLMSLSRILHSYAKDGLFFKVFKEIDPVTNVPVKGGWISIIPVCLCAFLMNLTQLAKLCSLCNLVTYSFIDAAVIALRLKPSRESGLNQGGGIRSRQNRIKKILL